MSRISHAEAAVSDWARREQARYERWESRQPKEHDHPLTERDAQLTELLRMFAERER